jgi:hypothetical protein
MSSCSVFKPLGFDWYHEMPSTFLNKYYLKVCGLNYFLSFLVWFALILLYMTDFENDGVCSDSKSNCASSGKYQSDTLSTRVWLTTACNNLSGDWAKLSSRAQLCN